MDFRLILPVIVTLSGIYLLVKLGAFFIIHPIKTAKEMLGAVGDRASRRAFFLALAGTLGVGNIFGVSAGIIIGGAGSLFWLLFASLFSMVIKYAETLLVFDEKTEGGGMSCVLRSVFCRHGGALSVVYAVLTLFLSLSMGAAMQSVAFTDMCYESYGISPRFSSLFLFLLLLPALLGNARKIESITEIVIPLTTIIYILACFGVIFTHISRLPNVINDIFSSAFNFRSAIGGGLSFIALREGFARGILSNEAGVGSSAMAHSRAENRSPHIAGLFAMGEVVFDSCLLCMLTGVAILLAVPDYSSFTAPMTLVSETFSFLLGGVGSLVLPVVILAFAYSTIICWYYYGKQTCISHFGFLSEVFPVAFSLFVILGDAIPETFLIYLIDIFLLLMSLMTLSAIIVRTPRIARLCKNKKSPD